MILIILLTLVITVEKKVLKHHFNCRLQVFAFKSLNFQYKKVRTVIFLKFANVTFLSAFLELCGLRFAIYATDKVHIIDLR